jgi:hypothetical protein
MCLSKSLLVQIEKEKKLTHTTQAQQHTRTQSHTHAPYTGTHAMHTPMHSHTLHTCTHAMHMHTRHAQAHTSHTHTHTHNTTHHAQHALHKGKNLRAKEGNPFKHFSKLELLTLPNTSLRFQRESPAPRWSCKLVEQQLQSWFGGAGALPNTPLPLSCD